jgi:hypothetical protein
MTSGWLINASWFRLLTLIASGRPLGFKYAF